MLGSIVLLGAALLAGRLARGDRPIPLPGPGPRPHGSPVAGLGRLAGNGSCAGCHTDIAAEWNRSLHRRAFVDPVFRSAYDVEPIAFCRGCHAPESDPEAEPTALAQAVGVGCTTCHVEDGHVVSATPASAGALHPVFVDARLATAAACAGCHQFDFPEGAHQRVPEAMQDTMREHAASRLAAVECQSCHMPLTDGAEGRHHRHDFTVLGDPTMIRRAARVTAERLDGARAQVTVAPGEAGHAFPTGDMFRRVEVRLQAIDGAGVATASAPSVELSRSFRDVARDPRGADLSFERVTASDTRVPPPGGAPRRVVLELPAPAAGSRLRYQVVYQRMSTPMAEAFHVAQVLDEIVVAEGILDSRRDNSAGAVKEVSLDSRRDNSAGAVKEVSLEPIAIASAPSQGGHR